MYININSNVQNILHETERAILVKAPKSEWKFWLPKKLFRTDDNGYTANINLPLDMEISIFRTGKGKYNKFDKIAEEKITATELQERFWK